MKYIAKRIRWGNMSNRNLFIKVITQMAKDNGIKLDISAAVAGYGNTSCYIMSSEDKKHIKLRVNKCSDENIDYQFKTLVRIPNYYMPEEWMNNVIQLILLYNDDNCKLTKDFQVSAKNKEILQKMKSGWKTGIGTLMNDQAIDFPYFNDHLLAGSRPHTKSYEKEMEHQIKNGIPIISNIDPGFIADLLIGGKRFDSVRLADIPFILPEQMKELLGVDHLSFYNEIEDSVINFDLIDGLRDHRRSYTLIGDKLIPNKKLEEAIDASIKHLTTCAAKMSLRFRIICTIHNNELIVRSEFHSSLDDMSLYILLKNLTTGEFAKIIFKPDFEKSTLKIYEE